MILKSILVSNWRCFISPLKIGPLSESLNVIHAPNATGKSTLFEALRRGLIDGHNVKGKDIREIQPWGRALSPLVAIEFFHQGNEYRITKQFINEVFSKLERKENGRFVPLDNGRRADEKVRQILSLGFPARGLSGSKDWGMAQILWAPQGDLSFGSLTGDLINDIRNSLDVQLTDATEGEIGKRIEETYSRLYTSGGKLRTGKDSPELIRLKEKLQEAKQVYLNISQQVQEYRESVRRIEDYRLTREQARRY